MENNKKNTNNNNNNNNNNHNNNTVFSNTTDDASSIACSSKELDIQKSNLQFKNNPLFIIIHVFVIQQSYNLVFQFLFSPIMTNQSQIPS